jgi:hypothetical protein
MRAVFKNPVLWLFVSLTLGLAPFSPEPHVVDKLRWVLGGAAGMLAMDWLDLLLHLTPWLLLLYAVLFRIRSRPGSADRKRSHFGGK